MSIDPLSIVEDETIHHPLHTSAYPISRLSAPFRYHSTNCEDEMDRLKFKEKMARFPRSKVWDKVTQQNIDAVRAFVHRHPQPTISTIQNASVRERPLKGPFRLVQDTLTAPTEDDVRQLLFRTISDLGEVEYDPPDLASVPVEWIGREVGRIRNTSAASPNKRCDLERLTQDCTTDLTILHVHGGAYLYD